MRRILAALVLAALLAPALAGAQAPELGPRLAQALADPAAPLRQADGSWSVWVHFTDKDLPAAALDAALDAAESRLAPRALARRAKVFAPGARRVDGLDLPVAPAYVAAVTATGARPRQASRWLNAASFDATPAQIDAIAQLPFVREVDLVAKFVRPERESDPGERAELEAAIAAAREAGAGRWDIEYGGSTAGLEQINVPPVHDLGLSGAGVVIGMLDAGFRTIHTALQDVDILATWDFVHGDAIVDEEPGDAFQQARHGTHTLSTLAGFENGELVGPAYGASVILAMTEDVGDELPIEEDNWVAGLEWVESLGADIVSTSLGYYYWYDFEDMDGETAVTTVAGDMAVGRGLLVVTSAGNERDNPDFPHILAPADGDSIIAVGAVDLDGNVASFSSPGPTYDGRIKPDLAAQGVGNFVASYYGEDGYYGVNGTSFACPLTAGVAALLLERLPELTPMQIREALRETASHAGAPDNDYGWGIVDALAALEYWGPSFDHAPLGDTEDTAGPYTVSTSIHDRLPLDPSALTLFWRLDGGAWQQVPLAHAGGDLYSADIPGQAGGLVEYYLQATDTAGYTISAPLAAPAAAYAFGVGIDTVPPVLFHVPLIDQVTGTWPPLVHATATDNLGIDRVELTFSLNGGAEQGPFPLTDLGDSYSLPFPLASVQEGDALVYTLRAWDTAATANSSASGPHGFEIVGDLGTLLVIDGNSISEPRGAGERDTSDDMGQWLLDAGYLVDYIDADDVGPGSFGGYDAVVFACGRGITPIGSPLLRAELRNHANDHGRLLIEGGGVVEMAFNEFNPYPEFAAEVLHVGQWWGDAYFEDVLLTPNLEATGHAFLHRPHALPDPVVVDLPEDSVIFAAFDYAYAADDALAVLRTNTNSNVGGVIVHDDTTGPEAGQVVLFTFDISFVDPTVGRELTENALAYLLAEEAPGSASIAGHASFATGGDAEGVTISCWPDQTVLTDEDGDYTLVGLHGSTYTVTAELDGHGTGVRTVTIAAGEALTGVDFVMSPVVEVSEAAAPEAAIPDNDPVGVSSVITVTEAGAVHDLNLDVDISHYAIGNLIVTITGPGGTVVTLHNRSGGNADDLVGNWPLTLTVDGPGALADFTGEEAAGDWTLNVADLQGGAIGIFHSWALNLSVVNDDLTAATDAPPRATRLLGNAPNPFNPSTEIRFELARAQHATLDVFDLSGRRAIRLLDARLGAGQHAVSWDGRNGAGRALASGMYFARLSAGGQTDLRKMLLIK